MADSGGLAGGTDARRSSGVGHRARRFATVALIASAALSITAPARANGRFPQAQTVVTVPGGDGSTAFLRTTFGILVSRDAGKRWRWICERALGYDGQWDPPIAATRDGRLWVGLEGGLTSTRDGCEVEPAPELAGETVKDLTTDARGETLYAITGAPGKKSFVWRRSPGKRFERLAGMDETNFMTIEVAPSLPSRVYVSGQSYSTIRGQIFRSDDGGATLESDVGDGGLSSSGLVADGPFFIAAVDPQDPSRLLVRHLHAKGSDLLSSRDGGKTFKNVLSMTSAMFGFAKSADGKTYWAGSGLAEHGIFRSTDRGERFEVVSQHAVLCLHSAGPGALFVCENPLALGAPAIAVSRDDGRSVTPLARFTDVEGPVACDVPDARASLCAWPEMQALFTAPPPAEVVDAGRPRRSKRDGGTGDAGAGGSAPRRSSCGCGLIGADRSTTDLPLLIAGLLSLLMRARSRVGRGSKAIQQA
jgi:photosystem II stability/assembly factor-like uncharacterized protein